MTYFNSVARDLLPEDFKALETFKFPSKGGIEVKIKSSSISPPEASAQFSRLHLQNICSRGIPVSCPFFWPKLTLETGIFEATLGYLLNSSW